MLDEAHIFPLQAELQDSALLQENTANSLCNRGCTCWCWLSTTPHSTFERPNYDSPSYFPPAFLVKSRWICKRTFLYVSSYEFASFKKRAGRSAENLLACCPSLRVTESRRTVIWYTFVKAKGILILPDSSLSHPQHCRELSQEADVFL